MFQNRVEDRVKSLNYSMAYLQTRKSRFIKTILLWYGRVSHAAGCLCGVCFGSCRSLCLSDPLYYIIPFLLWDAKPIL